MAYTTTADVKMYLGVTTSTDDTLIAGLVAQAEAAINAATQRIFDASTDSTHYLDAVADVDGRTLLLRDDLASITSIVNGDGTTVTSGQYVTNPRNEAPYYSIRLLASSGVTWGYTTDPEDAIAVTGKWAYSTTAPYDIQQACTRLAAWMYRQRENRTGDDDRTIIAGNATLLPSTVPSDIRTLLAPYRRRR